MLSGDTIHKLDEFGSFPWERFSPDNFRTDWTLARGGYGLPDQAWHLDYIHKTGAAEIWQIPPSMSRLIDWCIENGREQALRDVRMALRISH